MKQFIWFEWMEIGEHCYPGHPTLGVPHMHNFLFRVELETDEDREIEFLDFRKKVRQQLLLDYESKMRGVTVASIDFGEKSCETLCQHVGKIVCDILGEEWRGKELIVSVSESDEGAGAIVRGVVE